MGFHIKTKASDCETIRSAPQSRKHLFPYLVARRAVSLIKADMVSLVARGIAGVLPSDFYLLERTGSYSSSQHVPIEVNEGWKCIHTSPPTGLAEAVGPI